jgi:hypothetical protein
MDWIWILIGTVGGAAAMFVWLGLAWMALPHHNGDFRGIPEPEGLDAVLDKLDSGGAFYCYPFMKDYPGGQNDPDLKARLEKGPNAMITMLPRGDFMGGGVFLRGFLLNLFDAFGLAMLCTLVAADVPGLTDKVALCAVVGAFLGVSSYGGMSNWMFIPWRFTWMSVFDRVIGFALIGLVLHFCLPGVSEVVPGG